MQIQLMSFGFKNGRPGKADAVLNARGVANPGTAAQRKRKTGCDKDLHADVMRDPKALAIIADIVRLAEEAAAGCRAACSSNTPDAAPLAPLADGGTADGASTPCCSRSDDEPAEERDEAEEESQEDEEEEEEEEEGEHTAGDAMAVAVGCHAGRHRSVAIVVAAARQLHGMGFEVAVCHRDL